MRYKNIPDILHFKKKNNNNNKGIICKSKYMRREEWNNFTNYKYEEYLTMNKK